MLRATVKIFCKPPPHTSRNAQFANNLVDLQIKTLTAFKKIGTQGVHKDLQFCCQFYNARKMEKYHPKCNITNYNIMTNLFFECQLLFNLITVIFKIINLQQLLNGFITA
jgi:hypothetical protein